MSRAPTLETQLRDVSVQGLVQLRNCADRLIAQKLKNERATVRQQVTALKLHVLRPALSEES